MSDAVGKHRADNEIRMTNNAAAAYDVDTVSLMREVVGDAWERLSAREQDITTRSLLADRVLRVAAAGGQNRSVPAVRPSSNRRRLGSPERLSVLKLRG